MRLAVYNKVIFLSIFSTKVIWGERLKDKDALITICLCIQLQMLCHKQCINIKTFSWLLAERLYYACLLVSCARYPVKPFASMNEGSRSLGGAATTIQQAIKIRANAWGMKEVNILWVWHKVNEKHICDLAFYTRPKSIFLTVMSCLTIIYIIYIYNSARDRRQMKNWIKGFTLTMLVLSHRQTVLLSESISCKCST